MSVRDINVLNQEWQRQLVGRKYVKHEDDGFDDLKVCFRSHYPFSTAPAYSQYYIILSWKMLASTHPLTHAAVVVPTEIQTIR